MDGPPTCLDRATFAAVKEATWQQVMRRIASLWVKMSTPNCRKIAADVHVPRVRDALRPWGLIRAQTLRLPERRKRLGAVLTPTIKEVEGQGGERTENRVDITHTAHILNLAALILLALPHRHKNGPITTHTKFHFRFRTLVVTSQFVHQQ
jgi:hypothetical protein